MAVPPQTEGDNGTGRWWFIRIWFALVGIWRRWMRPTIDQGRCSNTESDLMPHAVSDRAELAEVHDTNASENDEEIQRDTSVIVPVAHTAEDTRQETSRPSSTASSSSPYSAPPPRSLSAAAGEAGSAIAPEVRISQSPVHIKHNHFGRPDTGDSPSVSTAPAMQESTARNVEPDDSPIRRQEWKEHASHSSLAGTTPTGRALNAISSGLSLEVGQAEEQCVRSTEELPVGPSDLFILPTDLGEASDCSSGGDTETTESSLVLVDRPDSPGMKVHNTKPL